MPSGFFGDIKPIAYEGATSENPLAYRCYDATRVVMGKPLGEWLRYRAYIRVGFELEPDPAASGPRQMNCR